MKAFGEYVDFTKWLQEVKDGVEHEPDFVLPAAVKRAEDRWKKKLVEYLGYDDTEDTTQ